MPPSKLKEPYHSLQYQIIETMMAGNGNKFPESHSDMQYCVRALLRMFEVKRSPIAIDLPFEDQDEDKK